MGLNSILCIIRLVALAKGYSEADIAAGVEYASRKTRRTHPPGRFDKARRFYSSEPFHIPVREPSREYPFSQMTHARTAGHVAHQFGAGELATKRIGKLVEAVWEAEVQSISNHQAPLLAEMLSKKLKAAS
ncbi:hypothetical protein [Rubellimicrobium aerolatum]|uniref:MmgE/PrpD family protein n=1 Tax=Rubellimicrobium aerolatum TaxID=490979 RepID=A0ABW0S8R7_9RHOB|nr:hypothetical protein [Rubellimicrobium aerolatum]MBP1804682.1 hypothetical protein [Rubellimicrobium aerolatum]